MSQTRTRRAFESNRAPVLAMALVAVGGWGMFAYATQSATEAKKQLQGQIAILRDYQVQYLSERRKTEEAAAELDQLRGQLSTAKQEFTRLSEEHGRVQAELASTQAQLGEAQAAQARQERMPLIDVTPRPTSRDVKAAQETLTELGYGELKADGVMGEQTREAIEKYQRDKGLAVTGELYAETLQILLRPGGAMASQQDEP